MAQLLRWLSFMRSLVATPGCIALPGLSWILMTVDTTPPNLHLFYSCQGWVEAYTLNTGSLGTEPCLSHVSEGTGSPWAMKRWGSQGSYFVCIYVQLHILMITHEKVIYHLEPKEYLCILYFFVNHTRIFSSEFLLENKENILWELY